MSMAQKITNTNNKNRHYRNIKITLFCRQVTYLQFLLTFKFFYLPRFIKTISQKSYDFGEIKPIFLLIWLFDYNFFIALCVVDPKLEIGNSSVNVILQPPFEEPTSSHRFISLLADLK